MNWPQFKFTDFCRMANQKKLADLPKCPATQRYKAKEYQITKALSAFVKHRDGRELGPDWARN